MIPGVSTPTEIMNAYNLGVKIVKFFPCNIELLKQYVSVFKNLDISIIATGGINISNYKEVLDIPKVIAVGSSSILTITE